MEIYQRIGALRFIVTMQWEKKFNPCGTITYFDDDQQVTKGYCSLTDLIFRLDAACDEQGHPTRDTILRSFGKTPLLQEGKEDVFESHTKGNERNRINLLITICTRLHSSMQGVVRVENEKVPFRSEMELQKLLYELSACEKCEQRFCEG